MPHEQSLESFDDKSGRTNSARGFNSLGVRFTALCALAAVGGAVHYAPALESEAQAPAQIEQVLEDAPRDRIEAPAPAARPAPVLNREQQNIARFIAQKYRLAVDQTQQMVEFAYRSAREVKVDPWLILAVISVESAFDPTAQSTRGAQGLMQVHTRVHKDKFTPFGGVTAAFDPLANMRVGAQILKGYIARDGSVEGALKSYVGAAALPTDGGYGEKVLTERERIAAAAGGLVDPRKPVAPSPKPVNERVPTPVVPAGAAIDAPRGERRAAIEAESERELSGLLPYGNAQDRSFGEPAEIDRRGDNAHLRTNPSAIDG